MARIIVCAAAVAAATAARFSLSNYFGNSMVLQRDVAQPIWGWGSPNTPVYGMLINTVTNATFTSNGTVDDTGFFSIAFPPQGGSTDAYMLTVSTAAIAFGCPLYAYYCVGNTITLSGVVFGETVLCFGQSNMEVTVSFAFNSSVEMAAANDYGGIIRLFQVGNGATAPASPLDDFTSVSLPWAPASNVTAGPFSATCWFSGKAIVDGRPASDKDIPLGLVESSWGGTPIKAWTSGAVNDVCMPLYPYPAEQVDCGMHHAPCLQSSLFNAMIAPFDNGLRPAYMIWFQGENDVSEFNSSASAASSPSLGFPFYSCQLGNMIQDMRQRLQVPNAHFTTIQLAPYGGGGWLGSFREMQCATTLSLANTSCTVIDDDGDLYSPIGNVHSRNKQLVGRRVAAGILANVYGTGQQAIGPTYAGATFAVDGTTWTANVTFAPGSLAGGLVYVAPYVSPWQNSSRCPTEVFPLSGCDWLNIRGSDGQFYNATTVAIINGATALSLTVENAPAGVQPVGTRFGIAEWPVISYMNTAGFPLAPWNVTVA